MEINTAVVTAAGLGTRLQPLSRSIPKVMLPVGRKPVLQHVVDEIRQAGIRRVIFITSHGEDVIRDYFLQDARHEGGMSYEFLHQAELLGLGHAVLQAREAVGNQPFLLALGDSIISQPSEKSLAGKMIRIFQEKNASQVVAVRRVPENLLHNYGVVKPEGEASGGVMKIIGMVEKPPTGTAPSSYAVTARYVLGPEIFDALLKNPALPDDEWQLTNAMHYLLETRGRSYGVLLDPDQKRHDIGRFESYFHAFTHFAITDSEVGPALRAELRNSLSEERS